MKPNIIIFSLEPLETRYTAQWYSHVPQLLEKELGDKFNIIQIDGDTNSGVPTDGAFLDFVSTNQWKNEQANKFLEMVKQGIIHKGDQLLFTDAWNPTILEIKYVNDLQNMNWKMHGQWHAGNYDKNDFLGRLGHLPWLNHIEKAFFHAIDHNYFATDFHIKMFAENLLEFNYPFNYDLFKRTYLDTKKIIRTGWPMDYMPNTLAAYKNLPKRDLILFPHRIAPEKQVEIFRDLATRLPQYEFIVCQDEKLTKHEYHTLLGEAKMVFSASLQETLGIGCYEGAIVGAIPMVPDRLSYTEMYFDAFKYPSEWTESWDAYQIHVRDLANVIMHHMDNYGTRTKLLEQQTESLTKNFFSADELIRIIKST